MSILKWDTKLDIKIFESWKVHALEYHRAPEVGCNRVLTPVCLPFIPVYLG